MSPQSCTLACTDQLDLILKISSNSAHQLPPWISNLLFFEPPKVKPAPRQEQINRNRVAGDMRLIDDYFTEGAKYKKNQGHGW